MSDLTDVTHANYERAVTRVTQGLRDLADRIEREARDVRPGHIITPDSPHTAAAQRIIHEAMWGLANVNLDRVVSAATEADEAIRIERGDGR